MFSHDWFPFLFLHLHKQFHGKVACPCSHFSIWLSLVLQHMYVLIYSSHKCWLYCFKNSIFTLCFNPVQSEIINQALKLSHETHIWSPPNTHAPGSGVRFLLPRTPGWGPPWLCSSTADGNGKQRNGMVCSLCLAITSVSVVLTCCCLIFDCVQCYVAVVYSCLLKVTLNCMGSLIRH